MAERKIGAKIVLEGENEYREAVKSCNEQLTNMKTALQATEEHYKGNANSMEALTAKSKALADVHQAQIEKIDKLKSALQSAKEEQTKYSDKVIELKSKLETAAQQMSKLETSTEDTTDAQFALQREIDQMNSDLKTAENGYNTASDSVNHWQSQLNKAESDCNRTNVQIDRNKRYLDEAGNAADGCATSIDKYGKKVKDAGDNADNASDKTGRLADIFKGGMFANIATQALNTVVEKLKELASEALDAADEIQQISDVTGLTTDQIQELQYIGIDVGVSVDTITGSLKKLINNMDSARTGTGSAYEAFKKLGVSVTDGNGALRDSTDVLFDVIGALGRYGNETERDAVAQDLLGKSATDLNPLIKQGSSGLSELAEQAHKTGAVMSKETVEALDAVGDKAEEANMSVKAFIGTVMAAAITTPKSYQDNGEFFDSSTYQAYTLQTIDQINAEKELANQRSESARNAYLKAQAEAYLADKQEKEKQAVIDATEVSKKKFLELNEAYNTTRQTAEDSLTSQMGLFADMSESATASIDDMISSLQSQVEYMNNYAANIKKAMEIGVDEGIVQKLSDGSTQSAAYLQAIVDSGKEKIAALNDEFRKVEDGKDDFSNTVADMAYGFGDQMDKMSNDFVMAVKKMDMYDDAYAAGENTINGLINGMNAKRLAVAQAMGGISDAAQKAYNAGMRIQSPSKAMAQSGRYTVEGAVQGIEESRQAMLDAMSQLADDALLAYRRGSESLSGLDSSGPDRFNVSAGKTAASSVVNNTVNNISQAAAAPAAAGEITVHVPVTLDGKVLTDVVTKVQSRNARASGRS